MSGLQQVHVRIADAATSKPTPVRLRVTDAAGRYYAPLGRLTQFATEPSQDVGGNVLVDGAPWAYCDGACEINLPPGLLHFSIAKGPEFRPVETDVQLAAGKLALRFQIERWADSRKEGWHSGDSRVHSVPPHAAILEAQAEDVAVVHLLVRQMSANSAAIPGLDAFSGQAPCLQAPGHLVAVNTENFHPELGSLGLLHCHRVVYPLCFGGPDGEEDWTLGDWCGQCHRKHGLVVWTRTHHAAADFSYGEPLVLLLLGLVDAFELTGITQSSLPLWYELLNIGQRIPLTGASGKDSNSLALGSVRTYVQLALGEELTTATWIEGLRAGRSFVSSGPLLYLTVNGQPPGSVIEVEAGAKVLVRAEARSWRAFDRLELIGNGEVCAAATASSQPAHASLEVELPVEHGLWLAARCVGAAFAHTSPISICIPGKSIEPQRPAASRLLSEVERMVAWCQTKARCSTDPMRERLLAGFVLARGILAGKMK